MEYQDQNIVSPDMAANFRNADWGSQQLSSITIFRSFTREELKKLYAQGEIVSLKIGSYAVIEGEPSRGLYVILVGNMSVHKNDATTGAMHRIAYLEAGNNFGEMSLFDASPRSASVSAESVCHLFHLDADVFQGALSKLGGDAAARFYKACAEELVVRFRKLNGDYIGIQQQLWRYALRRDAPAKTTNAKVEVEKESSEEKPVTVNVA